MYTPPSVFLFLALAIPVVFATTPDDLVASYSLTVSTHLPFPTATLSPSEGDRFAISSWSLRGRKIQGQPSNLQFVPDPFPSSSSSSSSHGTSPVLQVTYPAQTFGGGPGGVQFLSLFNGSISAQTMLLSYEVAFDQGFQFVKGGKLPGLRGGSVVDGCEGGNQSNGTNCWSTRLMWRTAGAGEVYAYLPASRDLCSQPDVICNKDDFGTSIGRRNFTFTDGAWNRIALLVQLNSPGNRANGNIMLFHNDVLAIQQSNLQIRSSTNLLVDGLFFSTFFGGDDPSWASPVSQHSFYRNIQLWASNHPSTLDGPTVSSAISRHGWYSSRDRRWWTEGVCAAALIFIYGTITL